MTSRIERGITIEGSIRGEGELEVAGRLRGALTLTGKLVVEPGGIVEADVEATDIEVAGLLAGSATAHNTVQVREGGRVEARIKAPRLMVDDGALFRGELMAQGSSASEPAIGLTAPAASKGALPAPKERERARDERASEPKRRDEQARGGRAMPGFRAPEPPAAPAASADAKIAPSRAPSTTARRGGSSETPVMPTLPKGRTKIRMRGGES